MKTHVGTDKDKTVVLQNPKTPNQPGQAYKFKDLADFIAAQERK
jgi:hypothetical protein